MNAYDIIIQPWLTEKSMEARTTEQRLEFLVRRSATKAQIARALRPSSMWKWPRSTFATKARQARFGEAC